MWVVYRCGASRHNNTVELRDIVRETPVFCIKDADGPIWPYKFDKAGKFLSVLWVFLREIAFIRFVISTARCILISKVYDIFVYL